MSTIYFPHHEDEIAQCEAATGETFVNYWLHCEHLLVNGQKMSKSAGNFYTLRDLIAKGFNGREIRWLLFGAHYRQKLNFTIDGLKSAKSVIRRIDEFFRRLIEAKADLDRGTKITEELASTAVKDFRSGLEDDLNIPKALAALFDLMKNINKELDNNTVSGRAIEEIIEVCRGFDGVLGVLDIDKLDDIIPDRIKNLAEGRLNARITRDYAKADALRQEILDEGWRLDDTPQGYRLTRI